VLAHKVFGANQACCARDFRKNPLHSHQSITGRIFSAAGRRRADGRAKMMARINANDDWRRFTGQVAEAT